VLVEILELQFDPLTTGEDAVLKMIKKSQAYALLGFTDVEQRDLEALALPKPKHPQCGQHQLPLLRGGIGS
jgi:hypothetical protein